jgi:hypothetical protein
MTRIRVLDSCGLLQDDKVSIVDLLFIILVEGYCLFYCRSGTLYMIGVDRDEIEDEMNQSVSIEL